MNIIISETLKELRKNRGNTQEELAIHVGVSDQAVSKWERGESFPDITLLPAIAFYYNVSVDDLLGVGKMQMEKKVAEYLEKSDAYERKGDNDGLNSVWAEAIKEFPNNYTVLNRYRGTLSDDRMDEILEISERLLKESNILSHRYDVICHLCNLYIRLGDEEKAIEYAEKLPMMERTEDNMLVQIYTGEKLVETVQDNLMTGFVIITDNQIYRMIWHGGLSNDEKRQARLRCLKLYDWLYEDGDYGFYNTNVARIYADLAMFDAADGNADGVMYNLSRMADCSIEFLTQKGFQHTSFLVNRLHYEEGFHGYSSISDNECQMRLNFMNRDWCDFCRDDERFKEIQARLSKYAGKRD